MELILPKKKQFILPQAYNKILLFGISGSGKSTTADTLSKTSGIPCFHSDLHRFIMCGDNLVLTRPYENYFRELKSFINNNNDRWIVDYTSAWNDTQTLEWLINIAKPDLLLNFDLNEIDALLGCKKRIEKFATLGEKPIGIPIPPGREYINTLDVNLSLLKLYQHKQQKISRLLNQFSGKIETFKTPNDRDNFIVSYLK